VHPFFSRAASPNANVEGYAWSPNFGWVSFHGENYRVNIIDNVFANGSYAWSPNVGWIAFGQEQLAGCPTAPCIAQVTPVGTQRYVSGWAKILSSGTWLSLSGQTTGGQAYGAVIDAQGGFSGYAWDSGSIGWLNFKGTDSNGKEFGVYTDALTLDDVNITNFVNKVLNQNTNSNTNTSSSGGGQDCAFYAEPSSVPEFSKTTLYWYCQSVTSCSLDGAGVTVPTGSAKKSTGKDTKTYTLTCQGPSGSKSYSTQVKVIKAGIKEVRPR